MDFRDSEEDAAFRAQAREALEGAVAALPGPEPATIEERAPYWRQFQRALHAAGYAGLSWPREYGRGGGRGAGGCGGAGGAEGAGARRRGGGSRSPGRRTTAPAHRTA